MKKVLIVGDSLTAGHPGTSFVDAITRIGSRYRVIAAGRGGDTLLGISRRLPPLIQRHRPGIVIIEAGTNDLLLPWFKTRGGAWRKLADRLASSGSIPTTEVSSFHSLYAETIAAIRQHIPAIMVTTISCLGEDVNNELNQQRKKYNDAIRHIAYESDIHLADVSKAFDEILQSTQCPGTYLLDEYCCLYLDTLLTTIPAAIDSLSRRRGLILTVDGVHLNRQGARLFADAIHGKLTCIDS